VAAGFANEGVDVAIADLDEHDDATRTAALVESTGRRCLRFPGDLADAEQFQSVVTQTAAALGGLDILVNVAYQNPTEKFTDITDDQWRRTFAVNRQLFFG